MKRGEIKRINMLGADLAPATGLIDGYFGVHKGDDWGYTVTHLSSGAALGDYRTQKEAVTIINRLNKLKGIPWDSTNPGVFYQYEPIIRRILGNFYEE